LGRVRHGLATAQHLGAHDVTRYAVFIAQAAPWSPATNGAVTAPAVWMEVKDEKDLDKYKGKLAGKIVLYGAMREVPHVEKPLWTRLDDAELKKLTEYPVKPRNRDFLQEFAKRIELRRKVAQFMADEHPLAVIVPSRDGRDGGGSGGTFFDDSSAGFAWEAYKRENMDPVPTVVMAIENYGRVYRLLKAHVPVSIEMNVETKFTGDHEHGFDTIAEIPGTDPKLQDEVVMVGE
jgi:carboxypeptidase Q